MLSVELCPLLPLNSLLFNGLQTSLELNLPKNLDYQSKVDTEENTTCLRWDLPCPKKKCIAWISYNQSTELCDLFWGAVRAQELNLQDVLELTYFIWHFGLRSTPCLRHILILQLLCRGFQCVSHCKSINRMDMICLQIMLTINVLYSEDTLQVACIGILITLSLFSLWKFQVDVLI